MLNRTLWNDKIRPGARNYLLCVFFAFVLWMDVFNILSTSVGAQVPDFLKSLVGDVPLWSVRLADMVVFLFVAFTLLRMNEVFLFIRNRTVLPSMIGIIIGGLLLHPHLLSSGLGVALGLSLAVFSALYMSTSHGPSVQLHAFNIGFLLGVCSIVCPPCALLAFVFFVSYYDFNVLTLRSILATLTGFLFPLLYFVIYHVAMGSTDVLMQRLDFGFGFQLSDREFTPFSICFFIILALILVWALFQVYVSYQQEALKQRRMFALFVRLLVVSLFMALFVDAGIDNMLCSAVIFAGVVWGRFFTLSVPESKPCQVSFYVFMGASVIYYLTLIA